MKIIIILLIIWFIYAPVPTYILKITNFFKKKESTNIYLTFDDGPSKYTGKLLDLLKKNNVKATFFIVAEFAFKNPKLIERMKKEGHIIGLHSLAHTNSMLTGPIKTYKNMVKSMNIMAELGVKPLYYRAPWGHFNLVELLMIKKYHLKIVLWNVMAEDWEANTTSELICEKIMSRVKKGDIICLHDGRGKNEAPSRTITALETALPKLKENGFSFEVIGK